MNYFISVEDSYDELIMYPEFNGPDVLLRFYTENFHKGCKKCSIGGLDDLNPQKKQLFSFPYNKMPGVLENKTLETIKEIRYPYQQNISPIYPDIAFSIGEIKG